MPEAWYRLTGEAALVCRGGREADVESSRLVPGDIVLLASGTRVPADLRLLETVELRIEEAVLTGEAVPAGKGPAPLAERDLVIGDQRNMAFTGTMVVGGARAGGAHGGHGLRRRGDRQALRPVRRAAAAICTRPNVFDGNAVAFVMRARVTTWRPGA